jgi:hypothetical protein
MHHPHQLQQRPPAASTSTPSSLNAFDGAASSSSGDLPARGGAAIPAAAAAGGGVNSLLSAKLPVLPCGGRTDAGVSAAGQVRITRGWQSLFYCGVRGPPVKPPQPAIQCSFIHRCRVLAKHHQGRGYLIQAAAC